MGLEKSRRGRGANGGGDGGGEAKTGNQRGEAAAQELRGVAGIG